MLLSEGATPCNNNVFLKVGSFGVQIECGRFLKTCNQGEREQLIFLSLRRRGIVLVPLNNVFCIIIDERRH